MSIELLQKIVAPSFMPQFVTVTKDVTRDDLLEIY